MKTITLTEWQLQLLAKALILAEEAEPELDEDDEWSDLVDIVFKAQGA